MLNWLAFLLPTTLIMCDARYRHVRAELATRQTFFHDVQALPRYLYFARWQALSNFMFTQPNSTPMPRHHRANAPNAADACCRTRPVVRRCFTRVVCAPATFRAKQSPETTMRRRASQRPLPYRRHAPRVMPPISLPQR